MFKFRKNFFIAVLLLTVFLFLPQSVRAESYPIDLYFFEGQGCPHCARMKSFLEGLKADYPNLKVYDFEVYFNAEGQALFRKMALAYGTDTSGVPTIFIDNEVIVGENFEKVKNAVLRCSEEACASPMDRINNFSDASNVNVSIDGYSPMPSSKKTAEIIGWAIIGLVLVVGVGLVIFKLRKKKMKQP